MLADHLLLIASVSLPKGDHYRHVSLTVLYALYYALIVYSVPIGNYQQALSCYKNIHRRFPESVDCLKFLVRLTTDLGLKEAQDYSLKLRKAEKTLETKKQVHSNVLLAVCDTAYGVCIVQYMH